MPVSMMTWGKAGAGTGVSVDQKVVIIMLAWEYDEKMGGFKNVVNCIALLNANLRFPALAVNYWNLHISGEYMRMWIMDWNGFL